MLKTRVPTILIFSILFSCKTSHQSRAKETKINGNEFVIFPFNPYEKYPLFKNSTPTTISFDEIIEIEQIAGIKILDIIKKHNYNRKNYDVYVRQYVGVINNEGEKEVWINVFCNDMKDEEWKKGIISVADGGDCAFNLKVNLNKKTYYDLIINLTS